MLLFKVHLLMLIFPFLGCEHADSSKASTEDSGLASYYADFFHGRLTASGAVYDSTLLTAAHRDLPFGQKVKVTNPANNKSVTVIINDRGPFVKARIIDLSKSAARRLEMIHEGVVQVDIELLD